MKFLIDYIRDGKTIVNWEKKVILFRKPRIFRPGQKFKYVQAKYDDHRALLLKCPEGPTLHVITTQGNDISEQCKHLPWYKPLSKRMGSLQWLDVGLYVPGQAAEHIKTALANQADNVSFTAFGYSILAPECSLEAVATALAELGISMPAWNLIAEEVKPVYDIGPICDGVVYKDSQYGPWAKLKHQRTIDLVVLGIKPGAGKYSRCCGSLICGLDKIEIAKVSGMDDTTRLLITQSDIGRVVEVEYERVASQGKLRHPRFLRWRDDKAPEACLFDQDPLLEQWHAKK